MLLSESIFGLSLVQRFWAANTEGDQLKIALVTAISGVVVSLIGLIGVKITAGRVSRTNSGSDTSAGPLAVAEELIDELQADKILLQQLSDNRGIEIRALRERVLELERLCWRNGLDPIHGVPLGPVSLRREEPHHDDDTDTASGT